MASLDDELRMELNHPKRADRVLVIVGSGVSMGATWGQPGSRAAAWKGLLELGLERCTELNIRTRAWANSEKRKLGKGDLDSYLAIATEIENRLRAPENGEFTEFLRRTVGDLVATDRTVLNGLAALANLGIPLATTNYDGLLEQVTGMDAVTWQQTSRVEEVLRGDDQAILHLHGHWRTPSSVVLGQSSYDRVLQSPHAQATLRRILASRSVVFIGCGEGLNDPDFGLLLRWAAETLRSSPYKHYRLLLNKEANKQPGRVPEDRIYPVPYGKRHAELGPFVQSLLPDRSAATSAEFSSTESCSGQPILGISAADSTQSSPPSRPQTGPRVIAPSPAPQDSVDYPLVALPPPPQRWYGRDRLGTELVDLLLQPLVPALALRGHPGQGKTALATWLLHSPLLAEKFGKRRYFVRCEPYRSRVDMGVSLASALGLSVAQHAEVRAMEELERGPSLLVLDNLESPWESDRLAVEDLLKQLASRSTSHGLALVVTLRGVERPGGVDWHALPPMPRLTRPAAQALFLHIAGSHLASDSKLNALLSAADDLPLAVELLAHQAEEQPDLEDLWQRWQDGHSRLLQRGPASSRDTNLQISIDLSVHSSRMTDSARRMLGVLAQLPAGMLRVDLRTVFGTRGSDGITVLHRIGLAQDEDNRWRLLNPVREHVRENHQALYHIDDYRELIRYFQQVAEQEGRRRFRPGGAQVGRRLTQEFPNFLAVLWKQASNVRGNAVWTWAGDPIPALQAVVHLYEFLYATELDLDNIISALFTTAQVRHLPRAAGWCAYILGMRQYLRGKLDTAEHFITAAEGIFSQCQTPQGQAQCVERLAGIAFLRGETSTAQRGMENALQRYAALGNRRSQAACAQSLARVALLRGDLSEAQRGLEATLHRLNNLDATLGEIHGTMHLGETAMARGELSEAQRLVEDALDRYAEMDEPVGQVNCISLLADIAQERGDLTKARHLLEDALHRNIKLGLQLGHASCIQALAVVALRRGDLSEARRGLIDAEKKYANLGTIGGQVAGLWSMAELALAHRDFQLAASLYGEAAERSRAAGYKWFAWRCQLGLAEVAQARGDLDAAEAEYLVACAFFRSLPVQDGLREGDGLFGLAGIARQRGSFDLAVDYCRQALECYRRCDATKKISNCERELTSLEATAATFQAGEADEP